jgi:cellulose synthase/poly-beta-1,6-N-acetylglucosamine synthase-like glycosyltransferase
VYGGQFETAHRRAQNRHWRADPAPEARAPSQARDLPQPLLPACPELDCVRHLLSAGLAAAAELRATEAGVGADRVLIAGGVIGEAAYLAALAAAEGFAFETLENMPREAVPLSDRQLLDAAAVGILPVKRDGRLHFIVAPRSHSARRLIQLRRGGADLAERFSFTTGERLQSFIATHTAREIAERAAHTLQSERPELSAGTRREKPLLACTSILVLAALLAFAPASTLTYFGLAFGLILVAWSGLRIVSLLLAHRLRHPHLSFADEHLPVYTIIVALYHEAAAVDDLVAALRRLDYPKEKLDIKLVLEADDRETRARLAAMRLAAPFEIIIAPPGEPRTKPRALNVALSLARGAFVAVFDAEDRPDPDQLRRALAAFAADRGRLACAQARLTIDNTADNWLTRLFTAEYAGLFDVFLPALAALKLPLPLGGSSNHFRADVLRHVGAWDPHNVTEDADLGMRLARDGYRTTVIDSSTFEEAPARMRSWLRQRTRWMKGWMQCWLVHMRIPRKLWRELGPAGFATFQLLVGGSVLAALVHPLFLVGFAWECLAAGGASPFYWIYLATLAIGYAASISLGLIGLARRDLLASAWSLLLTPIYWLMLSVAAWRALEQLARAPYRWEKTEHGLARTSRLTGPNAIPAAIRNISVNPPPRLPVGA